MNDHKSDNSFNPLLPYLQNVDRPTLWLADENTIDVLQQLPIQTDEKPLLLISNRYDIVATAQAKNITALFNDYDLSELPFNPERIIYRISKEKPLVHYLLNQCSQLLSNGGELHLSGLKQEGIKTYADKWVKATTATGKLRKNGIVYSGCFSSIQHESQLDDQNYPQLQTISCDHTIIKTFYSKPGVFGWQKIDQGTELLLQSITKVLDHYSITPDNVLDLGCGYGWIFLNAAHYLPNITQLTATDNNAAALIAAQQNANSLPFTTEVMASDAGDELIEGNKVYDLILCNPPFHQGFSHSKQLTEKFLHAIKRLLSTKGVAMLVVNEFISLPKPLTQLFSACDIMESQKGFKVIVLSNH